MAGPIIGDRRPRPRRRLPAVLALLLLGSGQPTVQPAPPGSAERVRAHVEFLADDQMEGRETGSRGHRLAAAYVASQFRALGLEPGGEGGSWYQQVPLRRAWHEGAPQLTLVLGGRREPLAFGRQASIGPNLRQRRTQLETGLVFVGYGLDEPLLGLDHYRGLDVAGKTVVALGGSPRGLPAEIAAHLRSGKAATAARHGAAGFVLVGRTATGPSGAGRVAVHGATPTIDWVEPAGRPDRSTPALQFELQVDEQLARRLFEGSPRSLAQVRSEAARQPASPPGFAMASRLTLSAASRWEDFSSPEVIGVLRGRDPLLRAEHVVLMGHLDHLGVRPASGKNGDGIYNGAIDNAAGVATLIEAARHFQVTGVRPRRSILFIANTGEEQGLLGADYFIHHPTVPIEQLVAAVDLDMPLALYPFRDVVAHGADHSTVARTIAQAALQMGLAVAPDPLPRETLFVRSDHYRLVLRGVPAILLMTGHANGGAAAWRRFLATAYHSPRDDLSQAIDWDAVARYGELNYRIARALADDPVRPRWYRGDYFGDRYAPGRTRAERAP